MFTLAVVLTMYLQGGKVDDTVDVWVFGEDIVQGLLVVDVAGIALGSLAADELDAVDDFIGGIVRVVDNDDLVVGLEQGEGGEGADVAGTTTKVSVRRAIVCLERSAAVSEARRWSSS